MSETLEQPLIVPLVRALTRAPTLMGVPYMYFMFNGVVTSVIFLASHNWRIKPDEPQTIDRLTLGRPVCRDLDQQLATMSFHATTCLRRAVEMQRRLSPQARRIRGNSPRLLANLLRKKTIPTRIATMPNRVTARSGLFWPNFSLLRYWICLILRMRFPVISQGICSLYRGKDRTF